MKNEGWGTMWTHSLREGLTCISLLKAGGLYLIFCEQADFKIQIPLTMILLSIPPKLVLRNTYRWATQLTFTDGPVGTKNGSFMIFSSNRWFAANLEGHR